MGTSPHPGLEGRPVYLDYNATTPVDPAVVEAMLPYLTEQFGNPSSTHTFGTTARTALAEARIRVAALIGAPAHSRIVFTGSGSEADALAIRGAVLATDHNHSRAHVITQATEHPAVLAACTYLQELHDVQVTVLPVDSTGLVDPDDVARAMTDDTVLVSVMHANNETGTLQPVGAIARVAHERRVLVHCDAAQAAGKVDIDVADLDVDLLTIVGHKLYAPKGTAALYVAEGVRLRPLVEGGSQESGLRAGTENVPYAVGLGRAAQLAQRALETGDEDRLRGLRDLLAHRLDELLPGRVHINGHHTLRLPNTLNISIDGVRALTLLADMSGLAASAGSACHAGHDRPSPVLTAMGLPSDVALTAIRLSLGRWTTSEEIELAATQIASAARSHGRSAR
jgi:cysteine desulfurase